jgi:uncharacterized protein (TIGR02145 family)
LIFSCKKKSVPDITTTEVTGITGTAASCGGLITDEGSGHVVLRGVCWSTESLPTTDDSKTIEGEETATFTSNISGLNGATEYFVRAYATNSAGTGYGLAISFKTLGEAPVPLNLETTNISTTGATLNGTVNANYLSTDAAFEYGTSTEYGQSAIATPAFITGSTGVNITANIAGLMPGTAYHFRIKAVNSIGTTYSSDAGFVTSGKVPDASTDAATDINPESAKLNGAVNPNLVSSVVTFEYGTTQAYGRSLEAVQSPLAGSELTNVSAVLSGLEPGITYHFRVKAENAVGISYGNDDIFITLPKDIDNNVYSTVFIGDQIWMGENLKTTRLDDGVPVDFAPDKTTWQNLSGPGYCWYGNNSANKTAYGALYNWAAVNTGKLCPAGWHVPTDAEWGIMADHLGGSAAAGGKLKESGIAHWSTPNTGASGESGFTALPGGWRGSSGEFLNMTKQGLWWSSSSYSTTDAYRLGIDYLGSGVSRLNESGKYGLSVRCLKD